MPVMLRPKTQSLLGRKVFGNQFDECWVEGEHIQPPLKTGVPTGAQVTQQGMNWGLAPKKRREDRECQASRMR